VAKAIVDVKGIGPASAALLIQKGIRTVEDLAAATIAQLTVVQGFSDIRAARVIEEAKALLAMKEKPAAEKKVKAAKPSAEKKKKSDQKKKDKKSNKKKQDKKKAKKKASDKKKPEKKNKKKK
jgi:transcription termination factor NusA